jgi:hypothetical protein
MRISKKCEIILNGNIDEVFPLFGFWEEKKWAYGWNPNLVFPEVPIMQKGTVFTTESAFNNEPYYCWIVSKFEPKNYIAEYTNSTQSRIWVIKVQCINEKKNRTKAIVSYTYTALNEKGKKYNQIALAEIFKVNLKDWEEAINYYLETGKILKP